MKRVFRVEIEYYGDTPAAGAVCAAIASKSKFVGKGIHVAVITDEPKDEIKVGIDAGDLKKTLDLLEEILKVQKEIAMRPLPVIPALSCKLQYSYIGYDGKQHYEKRRLRWA